MLGTMFVGAGMIPMYLLVSALGMIDSYWALILPTAVSAFNIVIMRGFFQGIDPGIIESARIDGASEWRILFQMVLPMSKAVVAVVALFYAVGYWNAFFNAVQIGRASCRATVQMAVIDGDVIEREMVA